MDGKQIVQELSCISNIPATFYVDGCEKFHVPDLKYLQNLTTCAPKELFANSQRASCHMTDQLLCYGYVPIHHSADHALFGPVASLGCDNERAQRILRSNQLPITESGQLLKYLKSVPICSFMRFSRFIRYANFALNGESIELNQFLPEEYTFQDGIMGGLDAPVEDHDAQSIHDAQAYERFLYSIVEFGQYDKLSSMLGNSPNNIFAGNEGTLAGNLLRHRKNLAIAACTIAARYAVKGGLDYETSMSLADSYIQKVELLSNTSAVSALIRSMLLTYTKKVWEYKQHDSKSAVITKVHTYVERNVSDRITTEDVANALGLNRSYLSTQFKKDTGIELSVFIMCIKIDEAKSLLIKSDLTVAEISGILSFASQSHLQAAFKKHTGMTPIQYRKSQNIATLSDL